VVSESLARCLAKISGDGYLYSTYIRYNNTCKVLREEFKKDITNEFGNVHFTEGVVNSGTPFVHVTRKNIVKVFLKHLPDFRSDFIYIPPSVRRSSRRIQKEYLRAFYDDEGSPSLKLAYKTREWKRCIALTSNSYRILEEIKSFLEYLSQIHSNKIIRTKPHSNYDQSYVLTITGKKNFIKFQRHIGFKHPRKIKKLQLLLDSYNATSRNKAAFEKLKNELARPPK